MLHVRCGASHMAQGFANNCDRDRDICCSTIDELACKLQELVSVAAETPCAVRYRCRSYSAGPGRRWDMYRGKKGSL